MKYLIVLAVWATVLTIVLGIDLAIGTTDSPPSTPSPVQDYYLPMLPTEAPHSGPPLGTICVTHPDIICDTIV